MRLGGKHAGGRSVLSDRIIKLMRKNGVDTSAADGAGDIEIYRIERPLKVN